MNRIILTLFISILLPEMLHSQVDFNAFYHKHNPVKERSSEAIEIKKLESFERDAIQKKDTLLISLSKIYLSEFYFFRGDYESATKCLIEAENLADKINHKLLKGRILHKKASVFTALNDYNTAIELFENSLELSELVKDSQYMAITMEQLGSLHGYQEENEKSSFYFDSAIPLIEKYWPIKDLAVCYSNYGNVLSFMDSSEAAIVYYKKALTINKQNDFQNQLVPCLQNLANELFYMDSLHQALEYIREARKLNEKNNWPRFQLTNHSIHAKIFEGLGDLDSAIFHLKRKLELSDSLIGPAVQLKIAELYQKQHDLETEQNLKTQRFQIKNLYIENKNLTIAILIATSLFLVFLSLFISNKRRNKKLKKESTETLQKLNVLLEKSKGELEILRENNNPQTISNTSRQANQNPLDLATMRILTNEDWDNFKVNFQESKPGFIQSLRIDYPGLTDAEERLFLLLSLNLKTGELANILGVQKETIKKTRSRLRKRLALGTDDSLEDFVKSYSTYKDK